MKAWRWVSALVLVGGVTLGVTASDEQAGDKPTWKAFDPDDKGAFKSFYQEMKTETNQSMKVQGMEVVQKQNQTFYVQWTPKSKEKDSWNVEYKIIGVKMDIQIGGNNITFDSTTDDKSTPQNPLTDFFKALINSKFDFTIANDPKEGMRVTDVKSGDVDAFVGKLAAANEQLKPLLTNILNKEALKQMSNPTFAAYPRTDAEWTKGTWTYDVTLNMGPIGSYKTNYTYTKNAKDPNKIDITGTMDYSAPKSGDGAGSLPFTIKSGDLKAKNISGEVILDPKAGRIASSKMTMELAGKLMIDIAGMSTEVSLDQKQTSTVTSYDSNPLPSPKKSLP